MHGCKWIARVWQGTQKWAETIVQILTKFAFAHHAPVERIVVAPDCGMKYLPRDVAFGKLCAMVAGASLVRDELT